MTKRQENIAMFVEQREQRQWRHFQQEMDLQERDNMSEAVVLERLSRE